MAKQDGDNFSMDMLAPKRGRPAKPHAPTAAERKAAQRARNKAEGIEQVTISLSAELLEAVRARCKATSTRQERTQRQVIEDILKNQLMRQR